MRLEEIMTRDVITISPDETAEAAWSRMNRSRIHHLIVTDGADLLGVLSDRDVGGSKGQSVRRGRSVRDLMTPQVATAKPATTLRQAANIMHGRFIGCLPVVDEDRLVGIVTATDVLQELGRGSTRPAVQATRRSARLPPASARAAKRKKARRRRRVTKRLAEPGGGSAAPHGAGDEEGASTVAASPEPITGRITPELGRERERQPENPARAPMARGVPRPRKRTLGRAAAAETPAYIFSAGALLDDADKRYLRRKLGKKLGKFASSIERTSVRIEDVNGPRGGIDKRCRIKVVVSGMPSIVVETDHHSVQAAIDGALAQAERTVRRALQRRRMKPVPGGSRRIDPRGDLAAGARARARPRR